MSNSTYGFPLLPLDGVTSFFHTHYPELTVKESDFKQPQRERWEKIFMILMSSVAGTKPDNINQCQFDQGDILDYPQLHEESMPLFNMAKAMQRFLLPMGIDDFNTNDILQPGGRRLVRICSAFINFANFSVDRLEVYDDIKSENAGMMEQREILLREKENLLKKINKIKMSREEQMPQVAKLKEDVSTLQTNLEELHKESSIKQKYIANMKADTSKYRTESAKIDEALKVAKEEGNSLSSKIVQSPERMKSDMDRQTRHLSSLKVDRDEKLTRLVELRKKVESLKTNEGESEQALRLITAINEKIDAEKASVAEIDKISEQVYIKRNMIRDLDPKEQQMKRQVSSKKEKLDTISIQHSHKKSELTGTLELLKQEKKNILESKNAEEQGKIKIQEKIRALKEEDKSEAQQFSAKMESYKSKYSDLLQELDGYHVRLGKSWSTVMENIQPKQS